MNIKRSIETIYWALAAHCEDNPSDGRSLNRAWNRILQSQVHLHELRVAAKCALADLESIMPEFEPSGDREHPAWETIKLLTKATK